jgi:elongation factor Ts
VAPGEGPRSKVAKLDDRENNQGAVAIAREGNVAAMVELKSETDFSAKSEDFVEARRSWPSSSLAEGDCRRRERCRRSSTT